MEIKKEKNIIHRIIEKIYVLCFVAIILLCLFYPSDWKKIYLLGNFPNIVLGVLVYAILAMCLSPVAASRVKIKNWNRIMLVVTIIVCVGLFILSYQYCFRTGWDVHRMLKNASWLAEGNIKKLNNEYYSRCPNNVFLTCIFSLAYRAANILHISDGYYVLLAVQSCIFAWAGYFIYRAADTFFQEEKRKYSLLTWLMYMLLAGLSPWIVIPYSDSVALFMVSLCLFLLFKMRQSRHSGVFLFLLTLCGVMGYYIKPQIFILFIAFFIVMAIDNLRKLPTHLTLYKLYKKKKLPAHLTLYMKKMGIMLLAAVIAAGTVTIVKERSGFKLEEEAQLGITHFFMMGWHKETRGVYYRPDVDYSISFPTKKERAEANVKVIKERMQDFGVKGVIQFICEKNLLNYNDGTFAWGVEGNFYKSVDDTGYQPVRKVLSEYYYNEGKYHSWFQEIMQVLWMGTIFLNIFAGSRKKDSQIVVLMLAILGLTLFETLFEARARYLFGYASVYIFLAVTGLSRVENFYWKLRNKSKERSQ